jgi:hypothetical protein
MDTDELSDELYEAIFVTAERFHHYLTLEFGLLAKECKNEKQYIEKAVNLIKEFKKIDQDEMEDIFCERIPNKKAFQEILVKISNNIEDVIRIPEDKRKYSF